MEGRTAIHVRGIAVLADRCAETPSVKLRKTALHVRRTAVLADRYVVTCLARQGRIAVLVRWIVEFAIPLAGMESAMEQNLVSAVPLTVVPVNNF